MNSRSRNTPPRKSGTTSRKPATIDLEAKNVEKEATKPVEKPKTTASAAKTGTAKDTKFGRPAPAATASKSAAVDNTASDKKPASGSVPSSKTGKTDEKSADASSKTGPGENAKPKPATDPTAKTPPAPAGKRGGGILGGIVGAAAAVAGLGVVGQIEGANELPLIGPLYSQQAAAPAPGGDSSALADLKTQIEALKADNERIGELESRIADLQTGTQASGLDEATANRISQIETGLAEVNETISSLATSTENGGNAPNNALNEELTAVTERLATLEQGLGELSAPEPTDLTPVENRLSAVETTIGSVEENVAALMTQSTDLQETVASVKASEKVARSVAVNALGTALENDDPVNSSIASIEALGGKTPETERLSELAGNGIPSRADLIASLNTIINGVQNPAPEAADGTLSEKFWANARSLVSFRSSGPQEGDAPTAILSRVKAAVETGNLSGAKQEWEALPADIKTSGEGWIERLDQRMEAFELHKTLSSQLAAANG